MTLTLIFLVFGLSGGILFFLGLRRIWQWKLLSGSMQGMSGALLITLAVFVMSLMANLYTYQRLTHESPVATIRFDRIGDQYFRAYLQQPGKDAMVYDIHGDEWQLDARILKWHGLANLAGLDSYYQLERLSGRYHNIQQANSTAASHVTLTEDQGIDIWQLAHQHKNWIPWVDAMYGSAVYMPMSHGARYSISIGQTGLVTRGDNSIAQQAIQSWE